jgi:hypothetical protein
MFPNTLFAGLLKITTELFGITYFTTFNIDPSQLNFNQPVTATATATLISNPGGISTIPVTNGGSNYLIAPRVTITDPTGTGAIATANLTSTGTVGSITVNTAGSGYTNPTVTLSAPFIVMAQI